MDYTETRQEYRDETGLQTMVSDEVHEPHFTHEYVTWLESRLVKSSLGVVSKCTRCKELEFMITNGLGWEDLKDDNTYPID